MIKTIGTLALLSLATAAFAAPLTNAPQPSNVWAQQATKHMLSTKIMSLEADGKFHGDAPVTRFQLAVTLERFIHYIENGRKPLHATRSSPVIPLHATGDVRQAYAFLTSNNFIPRDSTLITKPGNQPVTASELGVVMGDVTIRISDRGLAPFKYQP